ncbi:hypothetical protein B2J93_47 [Marssonina coronariae]|uniref:Uncharacterized protein n=1 Tax=Diplocarpon coronariae TaxID=2795749 RepID=A0A218Z303_9HELO|nr:hypothetical protein B2J93_47 [Marssonina coronariae]
MVWEDDAVELQRVRQTSTTSHLKLPYFSNPRGMTGAQPSQSSNAHSSSRLRPSSYGARLPAHGMLLRTPRRIALSERTFPTSNTQNSAQGAQHPSSRSQAQSENTIERAETYSALTALLTIAGLATYRGRRQANQIVGLRLQQYLSRRARHARRRGSRHPW